MGRRRLTKGSRFRMLEKKKKKWQIVAVATRGISRDYDSKVDTTALLNKRALAAQQALPCVTDCERSLRKKPNDKKKNENREQQNMCTRTNIF